MSMRVIEVDQPGVDREAHWVKKGSQSIFGYKQHTVVDDNGWYWRLRQSQQIAMIATVVEFTR